MTTMIMIMAMMTIICFVFFVPKIDAMFIADGDKVVIVGIDDTDIITPTTPASTSTIITTTNATGSTISLEAFIGEQIEGAFAMPPPLPPSFKLRVYRPRISRQCIERLRDGRSNYSFVACDRRVTQIFRSASYSLSEKFCHGSLAFVQCIDASACNRCARCDRDQFFVWRNWTAHRIAKFAVCEKNLPNLTEYIRDWPRCTPAKPSLSFAELDSLHFSASQQTIVFTYIGLILFFLAIIGCVWCAQQPLPASPNGTLLDRAKSSSKSNFDILSCGSVGAGGAGAAAGPGPGPGPGPAPFSPIPVKPSVKVVPSNSVKTISKSTTALASTAAASQRSLANRKKSQQSQRKRSSSNLTITKSKSRQKQQLKEAKSRSICKASSGSGTRAKTGSVSVYKSLKSKISPKKNISSVSRSAASSSRFDKSVISAVSKTNNRNRNSKSSIRNERSTMASTGTAASLSAVSSSKNLD